MFIVPGGKPQRKIAGIGSGGLVKLMPTARALNVAAIDVRLSKFTDKYSSFYFVMSNMQTPLDAFLQALVSGDGGVTWNTTTYSHVVSGAGCSATGFAQISGAAAVDLSGAALTSYSSGGDAGAIGGNLRITNNDVALQYPKTFWETSHLYYTGAVSGTIGAGFVATAMKINAVRFKSNSGNLTSGCVTVYGLT